MNHLRADPHARPATGAGLDHDALYDPEYFDQQLHHDHWFRNNAAKRELRWREVLRMLALTQKDCVLDLGCAAGEHSLRLAPLCGEVVGIDLAAAAIERAEARAASAGVANVRFLRLDAADLASLADASFDKIAAIDFVEHVGDDALLKTLGECRRLLRPSGRLAIFTPCASHYVERMKAANFLLRQLPGHIAVRMPEAYCDLLQQRAFAVDSVAFSPSTYPMFGRLDRWLCNAPVVGPLFRFRICIVARPAVTPRGQ